MAVITTLASLGNQADTGKIFRHAITYTLLTTIAAAAVGLVLYNIVSPGNLPTTLVQSGMADVPQKLGETSYYDHILGVIPNNIIKPFAEGNVLSILILAAAAGIALAKMPSSDKKEVVMKGLFGLQDLLFMLIHGLIWALPLGIVAFAAQLSAQFARRSGGCLRRGGGGCAAASGRLRRGRARLERNVHRRDGPAARGGRLHAQKEGAQRRNEHGVAHLLAERDGNFPLLHLRPQGKRPAAV